MIFGWLKLYFSTLNTKSLFTVWKKGFDIICCHCHWNDRKRFSHQFNSNISFYGCCCCFKIFLSSKENKKSGLYFTLDNKQWMMMMKNWKKNLDPSSHKNIRKDFDKDNLIILWLIRHAYRCHFFVVHPSIHPFVYETEDKWNEKYDHQIEYTQKEICLRGYLYGGKYDSIVIFNCYSFLVNNE